MGRTIIFSQNAIISLKYASTCGSVGTHHIISMRETYIVVLAVNLGPASAEHVVTPGGEFPVELLVECPEETEDLDSIESGFGVEIHSLEFLEYVVHEGLDSPRILVIENIL